MPTNTNNNNNLESIDIDNAIDNCSSALDCLGNSCRRKILRLLVNEPHYVSQLAKILDLTQPAVLKQMNILKEKGLVIEEKGTSFVTREKAKGPEPTYFKINKAFLLTFVITPYSMRENLFPLDIKSQKVSESQLTNINNFSEFSEKIQYINNEIAEINYKTRELEEQVKSFELQKMFLIQEANNLIRENDELRKDTESNYLQRLILRKQLCEDKSCVEEIQQLLNRELGEIDKISSAMKAIQDKNINLNIS